MSQQRQYTVYALVHPIDKKVRYVGISIDPEQRFKQHLRKSPAWIQELLLQGLQPVLSILQTDLPDIKAAREQETFWIHRYEGLGHVLENIVQNEGAIREREEEAHLQARLEEQYCYLPQEQMEAVIEITKGAYQHVGVCAWEDAFSIALFTAQELEKEGMVNNPIGVVEVAVLTLRRWNLRWMREDEYRKGRDA